MSLGRTACAVLVTVALGAGAVGSSVADDGDGKPSWKHKGKSSSKKAPSADHIASDRLGDADRGVDIQSLAVFNRKKLDFVGLAITGRDFRLPTSRSVEVFLATGAQADKPDYRVVAKSDGPGEGVHKVRLYRVKGWATQGQKHVKCDKLRVQFDTVNESQIRIAVPRSCIGGARGGIAANATVRGKDPVLAGEKSGQGERSDVVPGGTMLTRRVGK